MIRQYELVERVRTYDANADEGLLNKAYVFAMKAHGNQTRLSGDPYFSHPLEVAGILTNIKVDSATIATALLHDVVEDTAATLEDIESHFGTEVRDLVDGVTKLSRLDFTSETAKQAENFRKLMIAMSKDVRVLLVKLADRLHNMRTLQFHPKPESRRRIAQETLDIYAPLAGRMGMQDVKEELEDRSFETLLPEARASVMARLGYLEAEAGDLVERVSAQMTELLSRHGVHARVRGRRKSAYSTWRKMQSKEISFEQLSDAVGFRIVVGTEADCYQALGIIHRAWPMVPGRFKDYISTPKTNGYQSIHTTVVGPQKQRVEIQIRTEAMNEIAERGVAAHWRYKASLDKGNGVDRDFRFGNPYEFLRRLVEMLEHGDTPVEFLEHTKLEMLADQVFCFTPKGDVIALPQGATPVDFAYAIHSNIGDTCVGAKVNGRQVPLRTRLANGDSVEVIRSNAQHPDPAWENFVVTGKARSAIRRFVRNTERKAFRDLGEGLVRKAFMEVDHAFAETVAERAVPLTGSESLDDLYVRVGSGAISAGSVVDALLPGLRDRQKGSAKKVRRLRPGEAANGAPLPIKGMAPGVAVHLSSCCTPIPGDRIVGIVTPGKGLDVHTIDCAELEAFHDSPDRWVDLAWQPGASDSIRTVGRIRATLAHQPGALGSLCTVIGNYDGNIINFKLEERRADLHDAIVDIEVDDAKHLAHIIAALRATTAVTSVRRMRGH